MAPTGGQRWNETCSYRCSSISRRIQHWFSPARRCIEMYSSPPLLCLALLHSYLVPFFSLPLRSKMRRSNGAQAWKNVSIDLSYRTITLIYWRSKWNRPLMAWWHSNVVLHTLSLFRRRTRVEIVTRRMASSSNVWRWCDTDKWTRELSWGTIRVAHCTLKDMIELTVGLSVTNHRLVEVVPNCFWLELNFYWDLLTLRTSRCE